MMKFIELDKNEINVVFGGVTSGEIVDYFKYALGGLGAFAGLYVCGEYPKIRSLGTEEFYAAGIIIVLVPYVIGKFVVYATLGSFRQRVIQEEQWKGECNKMGNK